MRPKSHRACTITSTALSMSWAETHSRREWKLCSPAKRFGVGRPMKDKREPSVPPRIGRSDRLHSRRAEWPDARSPRPSDDAPAPRACCDTTRRPRIQPTDPGFTRAISRAQFLDERLLVLEFLRDEVPDQHLHARAVNRRLHLIGMQVSVVPVSGLRTHRVAGRRATKSAAMRMAFTMRSFVYPGCVLKPLNVTVMASAEKLSNSSSPRPPPSSV